MRTEDNYTDNQLNLTDKVQQNSEDAYKYNEKWTQKVNILKDLHNNVQEDIDEAIWLFKFRH